MNGEKVNFEAKMKYLNILTVCLALFALASAIPLEEPKMRFDDFKVYRFVPKTKSDQKLLLDLQEQNLDVCETFHIAS